MIKELGLQLYTLRDFMNNEEEIREVFQKIRSYGYTQAQAARSCISIPYEDFGRIAREEGVEIIGNHIGFDTLLQNFEQVLEDHRNLGTTNVGIGCWKYSSIEDIEEFIEKANGVARKAGSRGMKFTYHNHSHEFYKWENGKTTMEMLAEGLDPVYSSFVLDTYWVQHGGGDVRSWIEKLAGRIDILHLKDMKVVEVDGYPRQKYTEIGQGNMDWDSILETAQICGVKYYVVEQDSNFTTNCFASVKSSAEYLKKYIV